MTASHLFLRSPSQLSSLSVFSQLRSPGPKRVVIQDDRLDPETRRAWEQQISRRYSACGCDIGALSMLISIVGYVGWLAIRPDAFAWNDTLSCSVVIIGAALIGKLIGLWLAQRRLTALVKEIQWQWKESSA